MRGLVELAQPPRRAEVGDHDRERLVVARLAPAQGGDGALVAGVDYWQLPDIPAGTFKTGGSFLLVLTGCTSDASATLACGPQPGGGAYVPTGAPGVGNLALTVELNAFEWGRLGVDMLDRILKGETVGKQVFIKHRLVDATNVDEVLAQAGKN